MMKKTVLATLIPAVLIANSAFATEVYNKDNTSLSIGGHLSANVSDDGDNIGVGSNSPRINFGWTTQLSDNWSVDAKVEYGTDFLTDDPFYNRLGYIGSSHKTIGRFALGRQWSPYYSVMSVTDFPVAFANDFLYEDHGNLGTGRGNKMLSYAKAFNFSEGMALKLGAGWQGEQTTYDSRLQLGLQLQFSNFNVGYVFSNGDVADQGSMSNGLSASYGAFGKGLYIAGIVAINEGMTATAGTDSTAYEAIAAFGMESGLNLIVNFEAVDADDDVSGFNELALQAEYTVAPQLITYIGYQLALDADANAIQGKTEDDQWVIGARYFL